MSTAPCGCRWSWWTWFAGWPSATRATRPRCGSSPAVCATAVRTPRSRRARCGGPPVSSGPSSRSCGAVWSTCRRARRSVRWCRRWPRCCGHPRSRSCRCATASSSHPAWRRCPVAGPVREPLRCRPDAAYLITGGLGALGLLTAGWLADRGARRVILAGRTALPPRRDWDSDSNDAATAEKINAVRALEARGVAVEAVALDIGSPEAMQALLAKRDDEGAVPIRGVVHGAGITDAELFTELDESRLRRTVWPKIAGAQVLHQAFPPGSLDFMFLTAAAGAVFGVPGQGAYAAANAYLDGLAQAAPPAGLPHRQPGLGGLARARLRRRGADRAAGTRATRVAGHQRRRSLRRLGSPRALRRRAGRHGSDGLDFSDRWVRRRRAARGDSGLVGDARRGRASRTADRVAGHSRPRAPAGRGRPRHWTGRSPNTG